MAKHILICNDDGFDARGIQVLERALAPLGEITVVAPDAEQSASSHSLTVRRPIDVKQVDDHHYRVVGTPTDAIVLALQVLLGRKPDLIVSGINHGPNMGEDVQYSGTVAAASEGMILGVASIAISALQRTVANEEVNGGFARRIVERALAEGLPKDVLLNVNIPNPGRRTDQGASHHQAGLAPLREFHRSGARTLAEKLHHRRSRAGVARRRRLRHLGRALGLRVGDTAAPGPDALQGDRRNGTLAVRTVRGLPR